MTDHRKYTKDDIKRLAHRIRIEKENGHPFEFITGAGCSVTAGIPLAGELVKIINSDTKYSMYLDHLSDEEKQDYGICMSCIGGIKRKDLLCQYLDNAKLNWGHIALASMIAEGYVRRVLTFNFDNVLLRTLGMCGNYPATYDYALSAPTTSDHIVHPAIVHLHGQGHGLVMLNTDEETQRHSESIRPLIADTLNQSQVVVIGYSGRADNAFDVLRNEYAQKAHLYWCSYSDQPDGHVAQLLGDNPNTTTHYGGVRADDFLIEVAQELGCFPPSIFSDTVEYLRTAIKDVVPFKFQDSGQRDVKGSLEVKLKAFEDVEASNKVEIELQNLLLKGHTDTLVSYAQNSEFELSDPIKDIYNQAFFREAFDETDLAKQVSLYQAALDFNPKDSLSYINLGVTYEKLEQYDKAIEQYQQAFAIDSQNADIFYNWGVSLKNLGEYEEAKKMYEQALAINENDEFALLNLSSTLVRLGQLDEAEKVAHKLVSIKPGEAYNLACIMSLTHRASDCEHYLNACLSHGTLPNRKHLKCDSDLDNVRGEAWFDELLLKAQQS